MIYAQCFLNTKCHWRDYKPLTHTKFLNAVLYSRKLRLKHWRFRNFHKKKNKMKDDLRTVVTFFDRLHILNTFAESNIKTIKKVTGVQEYKVAELLGSALTNYPKEVIYNFTSYILSETVKVLLCKGLNVAIPPKKFKFENFFLPFEILFRDVCDSSDKVGDDHCLLHLKCKIKDVGVLSFRWYNKKDHPFENLTKDEYSFSVS